MANLLDLDDDEMFGNKTNTSAATIGTQYHGHLSPSNSDGRALTVDDLFGVTSDEGNNNQGNGYEADAFGISSENHGNITATGDLDLFTSGSYPSESTVEWSEKQSGSVDDIFDSFMHDSSNQASGMAEHSSISDDLLDLYPFLASNRDTNLEKAESVAIPTSTHILDDVYTTTAVSTPESIIETPNPELAAIGHQMEDKSPCTREKSLGVKKSLENSFEDLLQGLTDESDPDLDDMLSDVSVESSSNLESLIISQERTHQEHVLSVKEDSNRDVKNWFQAPSLPSEGPPETEDVRDVDVEEEDTWELVNQEEHAEDEKGEEEEEQEEEEEEEEEEDDAPTAEMVNTETEYLRHSGSEMGSETCTDVLIERQESESSQRSDASIGVTEGDDANLSMDLDAVQDTAHLDVDVTKHKTNLRKSSLAMRRKPSRTGRRSIIEQGEDKLFQDTTEPRPEKDDDDNEEEEVEEEKKEEEDVFAKEDMSPPHKKPTPSAIITTTTQGSSDPSSMQKSSPTDSKAIKPPPGAVKLPVITPSQLQRSSKENKEEITSPVKPLFSPMKVLPPEKTQSSDFSFDLPKLKRASVDKEEDLSNAEQQIYEKPSLRSIPKVERENKAKEDTGVFSKPELKSAPKVNSDNKSDEISAKGVFRKPSLRAAAVDTKTEDSNKVPYTGEFDVHKLRQAPRKGSESPEKTSPGLLETPILRQAPKPTDGSKTDDSDSHFFDKPSLRNTPKKNVETKPSETEQHTFTKPELRSINKTKTSEVRPDQDGHTFEKPSLRGTPPRTTKAEEVPMGKFDKPALRSVSRSSVSPEKEKTSSAKSGFEKPALKPVERLDMIQKDPFDTERNGSLEEREENQKPSWLINLRRTGGQSVEDNENPKSSEPEWLQAARNKKAKALEIIQSKENQNQEAEKPTAPWVESNLLRKTPKSYPLQENNTNEENRQIFNTGRERRLSSGSSKDSEIVKDARGRSPSVGTGKDNYVPSWMKGQSAGVTPPRISATSKPDLMKRATDELPQWQKALAEKLKARKESEGLILQCEVAHRERDPVVPIRVKNAGKCHKVILPVFVREQGSVAYLHFLQYEIAHREQVSAGPDTAVRNDEADSPGVPLWKQELSQKGLRAAQKTKATPETITSAEPEWKRQAEEKKERLRSRVQ